MTNKFTPGPWKARGQAGYTGHGVNDSTGRSVCSIPSNGNRDHGERNANAVLLAAAPDLLEALRGFIDGAEAMGWSTVKARAAIEKATKI